MVFCYGKTSTERAKVLIKYMKKNPYKIYLTTGKISELLDVSIRTANRLIKFMKENYEEVNVLKVFIGGQTNLVYLNYNAKQQYFKDKRK